MNKNLGSNSWQNISSRFSLTNVLVLMESTILIAAFRNLVSHSQIYSDQTMKRKTSCEQCEAGPIKVQDDLKRVVAWTLGTVICYSPQFMCTKLWAGVIHFLCQLSKYSSFFFHFELVFVVLASLLCSVSFSSHHVQCAYILCSGSRVHYTKSAAPSKTI